MLEQELKPGLPLDFLQQLQDEERAKRQGYSVSENIDREAYLVQRQKELDQSLGFTSEDYPNPAPDYRNEWYRDFDPLHSSALFAAQNKNDEGSIRAALELQKGSTPESVAQVDKTAKELGINRNLAAQLQEQTDLDLKAKKLAENPVMQEWIAKSPENATFANVDQEALARVNQALIEVGKANEKLRKQPNGPDNFRDAWARGQKQMEIADVGNNALAHIRAGNFAAVEQERQKLIALNQEVAKISHPGSSDFWEAVVQLPRMIRRDLPSTIGGATAGGLIGSAFPGLGTVTGMGAGAISGSFYSAQQSETGSQVAQMLLMKDDEGKYLDEETVATNAQLYGIASGVVEIAGDKITFGLLGKTIGKPLLHLIKNGKLPTVAAEMTKKGFGSVAKNVLGASAAGAVVEGGEEAVQEMLAVEIEAHTKNKLRAEGKNWFDNKDQGIFSGEGRARVIEAGIIGAKIGAVFGIPFGSIKAAIDLNTHIEANKNAENHIKLARNIDAAGSVTQALTPERMEQYLHTAGVDNDILIPIQALLELQRKKGIDIGSSIGWSEQDLLQALEEGGEEVPMPAARLHSLLSAEEMETLAPIIRESPESLTQKEAIENEEQMRQELERAQKEADNNAVFQDQIIDLEQYRARLKGDITEDAEDALDAESDQEMEQAAYEGHLDRIRQEMFNAVKTSTRLKSLIATSLSTIPEYVDTCLEILKSYAQKVSLFPGNTASDALSRISFAGLIADESGKMVPVTDMRYQQELEAKRQSTEPFWNIVWGRLDAKSLKHYFPDAYKELAYQFGTGIFASRKRTKQKSQIVTLDELADELVREHIFTDGMDSSDLINKLKTMEKPFWKESRGKSLAQEDAGHLGLTIPDPKNQGHYLIQLFTNANLATLPHELAHFFFMELNRMKKEGQLSESGLKDLQSLSDWTSKMVNDNDYLKKDYEHYHREKFFNGTSFAKLSDKDKSDLREIAQHEILARSIEQYLREGKAPNAHLEDTFARFKKWMLRTYKEASDLRVQINNDVRGIFDRMLSYDQEVRSEAEMRDIRDLSTEMMDKLDLKGSDRLEVQSMIAELKRKASDKIRGMREQFLTKTRHKLAQRGARLADMVPAIKALKELNAHPINYDELVENYGEEQVNGWQKVLKKRIRHGGMSAEVLATRLGFYNNAADMLNEMTKGGELLNKGKYIKQFVETELQIQEQYASPFDAEFLYEQAAMADQEEKMHKAIEKKLEKYFKDRIALRETQEQNKNMQTALITAHKIVDKQSKEIEQIIKKRTELVDKLNAQLEKNKELKKNDTQLNHSYEKAKTKLDRLLAKQKDLQEKRQKYNAEMSNETLNGHEVIPEDQELVDYKRKRAAYHAAKREIQEAVSQLLDKMPMRDAVAPEAFRRAAQRWGQKERRFIMRDKWEDALHANYQTRLNLELAKESVRRKKFMEAQEKEVTRVINMDKADPNARFALYTLGRAAGLIHPTKKMLANAGDKTIDTIKAFIKEMEQFGRIPEGDVNVDQIFGPIMNIPTQPQGAWKMLTWTQYQPYAELIKRLIFVEKENRIVVNGLKKQEFVDAKTSLIDNIYANEKHREDGTWIDRNKLIQNIDQFRCEQLIPQIMAKIQDDEKLGESFNLLYKPIKDATNVELELWEKEKENLKKLFFSVYTKKELQKMRQDKYSVPGVNVPITKEIALSVLLHSGNESNKLRLVNNPHFLNNEEPLTEEMIKNIIDTLDEKDVNFAQSVWDYLETFREAAFDLEESITGIRPTKIEASPVQTKFGVLRGGYYPVNYDTTMGGREQNNIDEQQGDRIFPSVDHGSMKERSHLGAGLALNKYIDVIPEHVLRMIHMQAFRKPVMQVAKFLYDKDVEHAIVKAYGKNFYNTWRDWIKFIANQRPAQMGIMGRVAGWARKNAAMIAMGWKLSTALVQVTGFLSTTATIGPRWAAQGYYDTYIGNPFKMYQTVANRSTMMKHRMNTMDREVNEFTSEMMYLGSRNKILNPILQLNHWSQKNAFRLMGFVQMVMCDLPTWVGSYNKALSEGKTESEAVDFADSIVETTQGSGAPKDLSALQRGNELGKLLTSFHTYFAALFNLSHLRITMAKRHGTAGAWLKLGTLALLCWFAEPVISAILRGGPPKKRPRDKDWQEFLLKEALLNPFNMIVGGRPLTSMIDTLLTGHLKSFEIAPIERMLTFPLEAAKDFKKVLHRASYRNVKKATLSAYRALGFFGLSGISNAQFYIWIKNGWDLLDGKNANFWPSDLLRARPQR